MSEREQSEAREKAKLADEQLAALIVGGSVAVFFVWYWIGQIQSVIELLRLAYG